MKAVRFEIPACPPADVQRLGRELGVSSALAQVLVRRGLADPPAARSFLSADERHPPSAFAGIEDAVAVILAHARRGERITIHGDYDVDGVCSTAVLVRTLRRLGADVDSYLPDRASDGYGLAEHTVRRLAGRGTRLLVTADCAITAVAEVELARSLGLEVVVTDHHAPRSDGALPRAPIVHPAVCGYPCRSLCATAVAHKLCEALRQAAGATDPPEPDLDLVALATIADVVPLLGENRSLARAGLRALAATAKPGLRALMTVARVDPGQVDERAVAFALAPRLNAAGRLYRADAGLELLLTEDHARAQQVARELDLANRERRQVERDIRVQAEAQIAQTPARSAYVLAGEGWHAGVIGIVASRLAERHHRPVVLIALAGDTGRGSGRSVDEFDLLAGLSACDAHLVRYGGHRAAAGLEIDRRHVEPFAAALCDHASRTLAPDQLVAVERVDAVVAGPELGMGLAEELRWLAPFGNGNPGVSLMVAGASFCDRRPMGEGRHVRFTVRSEGARARAVAFGNGGSLPVRDGQPAEATFTLEVNDWNGISEPRLVLRHARPAGMVAREPGDGLGEPAYRNGDAAAPAPVLAGRPADGASERQELVLFALP